MLNLAKQQRKFHKLPRHYLRRVYMTKKAYFIDENNQTLEELMYCINTSEDELMVLIREGLNDCEVEIKTSAQDEYIFHLFSKTILPALYDPEINIASHLAELVRDKINSYQGSRVARLIYTFVSYFFYIESGKLASNHPLSPEKRELAWFLHGQARYWEGLGYWIENSEAPATDEKSIMEEIQTIFTSRGGLHKGESYRKLYEFAYEELRKKGRKYESRQKATDEIFDEVEAFAIGVGLKISHRTLYEQLAKMPDGASYFPKVDAVKDDDIGREYKSLVGIFEGMDPLERDNFQFVINSLTQISHFLEDAPKGKKALNIRSKAFGEDLEELIKTAHPLYILRRTRRKKLD